MRRADEEFLTNAILFGAEVADPYLDDPGGEVAELAEVLRDALAEEHADAPPEEMEEALYSVLESLPPAESIDFTKALRQVGSAATVLDDPTLRHVASVALPIAGGAAGTLVGGPAGTAVGSGLGSAAAGALARGKAGPAPATAATTPKPPVASGSPAAAAGLALTQNKDVLTSLLALALGEHGRKTVGDGVPVGAVMNTLGTIFSQAAADADELLLEEEAPTYRLDDQSAFSPAAPLDRAEDLYARLLDAENAQIAQAMHPR